MFKLAIYALILFLLSGTYGIGFDGKFIGVPDDVFASQAGSLKSPILNGLNYQARTSVRLIKIDTSDELTVQKYPVTREFTFKVDDIAEGEYELLVNSYDFNIRNTRFKVIADQSQIQVYDDYLAADSVNSTSVQILSQTKPLIIEITDYKQYYQGAQSKLSELVMNSPLGVIFQNRLYTILAAVTVAMMVGPSLIAHFAPEIAERFNELQQEAYEMKASRESMENTVDTATELIQSNAGSRATGNNGRRK